MNPYTIGILVSLAVYLAVGTYVGRKVKHLDDYFVAGRQAPTLLIVGTLVASLLSTTAFLGEVGMAYSGYGALILALVAINVTGYIAGALFFGRHLRRSRALTVPEYFGQRFASRRVQSVAGIMIVVGLGAYLMAVTQGTALVVTEVSNVPYRLSLFVVWAGYTAFTFYSGSRGVVINDTMMFLLFTVAAFVAMGCVVAAVGGWYPAVEALATFGEKPGIISWHGFTGPGANWETPADALTWSVILGLAWSVVVAVSPWQASRYLMAKNEHVVIRSGCGAGLALLALYPALMFCGAAINVADPRIEPPEGAMIWAAQHLMPTLAGVIVTAGIAAAGLSSATTFLSLVAFSASHDIVPREKADEGTRLRISRWSMIGVGVVALALSMVVPPQHLLDHLLCRHGIRLVLGPGGVHERLEPPHHGRRRLLGHGGRLLRERRAEIAFPAGCHRAAGLGGSDSHRCGAGRIGHGHRLAARHRERGGGALPGAPARDTA